MSYGIARPTADTQTHNGDYTINHYTLKRVDGINTIAPMQGIQLQEALTAEVKARETMLRNASANLERASERYQRAKQTLADAREALRIEIEKNMKPMDKPQ